MDDETFENLITELEKLGPVKGLAMSDLLNFSQELSELLGWIIRSGSVTTEDVAQRIGRDTQSARRLLGILMNHGLTEIVFKLPDIDPNAGDDQQFQVTIRSSRNYRVPKDIWQVFDE